jgi:hypothetical protein
LKRRRGVSKASLLIRELIARARRCNASIQFKASKGFHGGSYVGQGTVRWIRVFHTEGLANESQFSTRLREASNEERAAQHRVLASLARQTGAYNPNRSWQLLGQAEHLAEAELASHFKGQQRRLLDLLDGSRSGAWCFAMEGDG